MNSAIMVMLVVADKPKTQYVKVSRSVLDKVLRDIKQIADRGKGSDAVNPGDGYAYALGKCNGQARMIVIELEGLLKMNSDFDRPQPESNYSQARQEAHDRPMPHLKHGCPECGSFDIRVEPFDFGRDSETGYSDSGERHICCACGHSEIL